ncbi:regulatory protein RecX [Gaoshiqia sediminis]|uniref:Regulatory protein RecX n=1 Tax=Gaoshiqia sediminis TaxID=2986998 RepID=A0AA41YAI7_9BACT|nr:regulatory protein RecX [Gaoshiqia sediminis]MCW0484018.1 RecX family transcriptional regulator [Gaoshiqia sediminis]
MAELNEKQREAYQRAAALCSRSERSSGSILQKLHDWGLMVDEAEMVLERLVAEKFQDDDRFARSYVRDKFRFNKWGRVKIAHHLRAEKVSPAIIEQALGEIEDDNYRETLARLLEEKNKNTRAANQYDRKAKLFRFAQSRGFEADLIYAAFDELERD